MWKSSGLREPFVSFCRFLRCSAPWRQWCCGTIFYGSGSLSTFEKLRFRIRFPLLTPSYGSGSGSVSRSQKHTLKKIENNLFFLHSKLFCKENIDKFHQIYFTMWRKKMKNEGNQIHNFIYCVFVRTFVIGTILLRLRTRNMSRFRLRFHTAKSYGSGSTTMPGGVSCWAPPGRASWRVAGRRCAALLALSARVRPGPCSASGSRPGPCRSPENQNMRWSGFAFI